MEITASGADFKLLREIARKLLDQAQQGEFGAIREVADRLDGKPFTAIEATIEADENSEMSGAETTARIVSLLGKMFPELKQNEKFLRWEAESLKHYKSRSLTVQSDADSLDVNDRNGN